MTDTDTHIGAADFYEYGPKDWGRWGPEDGIGRANLLDPATVLAASSCIRTGRRFSLALPLCSPAGDPCLPGRMPSAHFMVQDESHYDSGRLDPLRGGMKYADDSLFMACHGTTHMDALGHAYADGVIWNGYPAATTTGGLRHAAVDQLARRGVVGRAVLVDLARHEGVRNLPMHRQITLDEIQSTLAGQGTEIGPGDILILRTGIFRLFYEDGPAAYYADWDEPGVTYERDLVEFMAERDIAGLGSDTICNEQPHPAAADFPLHVALLRNLGISFHEALWLEEWAGDCADDAVHEAFYVAAPCGSSRALAPR